MDMDLSPLLLPLLNNRKKNVSFLVMPFFYAAHICEIQEYGLYSGKVIRYSKRMRFVLFYCKSPLLAPNLVLSLNPLIRVVSLE